jgi:hypothetical protein
MFNKNIFLFLNLLFWNFCIAQTVIKANLLTAIVAIPHIGVETKIGKQNTLQLDVQASFWKSFNGGPQQFVIIIPEFRHYFKSAFYGFYAGVHIGGSAFKVQKWNYINTDLYQKGYSLLYGGTVGYQFKINERFNADLFVGGGSQQGYYKGYSLSSGIRYDTATNFNKSGEIVPYRLGLMFVYKLL